MNLTTLRPTWADERQEPIRYQIRELAGGRIEVRLLGPECIDFDNAPQPRTADICAVAPTHLEAILLALAVRADVYEQIFKCPHCEQSGVSMLLFWLPSRAKRASDPTVFQPDLGCHACDHLYFYNAPGEPLWWFGKVRVDGELALPDEVTCPKTCEPWPGWPQ